MNVIGTDADMNMTDEAKVVTVFYSWQSDLPPKCTRNAIRNALRQASIKIEEGRPVRIVIDEATRDMPGSPNIPSAIAKKIEEADIFVGDITSIFKLPNGGKSLPNPNVTFELGLAVAHLGWGRVIMFFNDEISEFKELPFDFDRHRVSTFNMKDEKSDITSKQSALNDLARVALDLIIESSPKKPSEVEVLSDQEIKRYRDVENIKWFMSQININLINLHIRDMPGVVYFSSIIMNTGVQEVVGRVDFKLYDKKMEEIIRSFATNFDKSLSYDRFYKDAANAYVQSFGLAQRYPNSDRDEQKAFSEISESIVSLRHDLNRMLDRLREDYISIDTSVTDRVFAESYKQLTEDPFK